MLCLVDIIKQKMQVEEEEEDEDERMKNDPKNYERLSDLYFHRDPSIVMTAISKNQSFLSILGIASIIGLYELHFIYGVEVPSCMGNDGENKELVKKSRSNAI